VGLGGGLDSRLRLLAQGHRDYQLQEHVVDAVEAVNLPPAT
jgi:hypothetical protein